MPFVGHSAHAQKGWGVRKLPNAPHALRRSVILIGRSYLPLMEVGV